MEPLGFLQHPQMPVQGAPSCPHRAPAQAPVSALGQQLAHLASKWNIYFAKPLISQQRSARDL